VKSRISKLGARAKQSLESGRRKISPEKRKGNRGSLGIVRKDPCEKTEEVPLGYRTGQWSSTGLGIGGRNREGSRGKGGSGGGC